MSTNSRIKLNLDSLKTRREWKRHKVTDGHNVFRILPPFGEASNGYPYRKWQIIWGLFDPETQRARPFASSLTSEKKCPVTEFVQELKKKAETIKAQMQAAGSSEDSIKERLQSLNKLISDLSPKTVYIYNAADESGEVGLLELKSTAHKKMKAEMSAYIQDYNQDPTSLNSEETDSGVWFDIIRTGVFRDTEYDVKRVQLKTKNAQGKLTFEDNRSPLPEAVVENYDNLAYDLSAVYQVKTYAELADILNANMASIVEACSDADLNAAIAFEKEVLGQTPTKQTPSRTNGVYGTSDIGATKTSKPAGSKQVNLNLNDEEEEEETVVPVRSSSKSTSKASAAVVEDDFLAQADALLNS